MLSNWRFKLKAFLTIINALVLFVSSFIINRENHVSQLAIGIIFVGSSVLFYLLLNTSWKIVEKFSDWFKPDIIVARNPLELLKKRIAYALMPKFLCIIFAGFIADIIPLTYLQKNSSKTQINQTEQLKEEVEAKPSCNNPQTIEDKVYCDRLKYDDSELELKKKFQEFLSTQEFSSLTSLRDEFNQWIKYRNDYCESEVQNDEYKQLALYKCLIDSNNMKIDEINKNLPETGISNNNEASIPYSDNSEDNFQIGRKYARGEGIEKNFVIARMYFEKAAEDNHVGALRALGTMYEFGDGVEINLKTALSYYEQAAKLGDEQSVKYYNEVLELISRETQKEQE